LEEIDGLFAKENIRNQLQARLQGINNEKETYEVDFHDEGKTSA